MIERRKSRAGGAKGAAALVASVLAHAILLVLLLRYSAPQTPVQEEPPTLQATLVPPLRPGVAARDRDQSLSPDARGALARTAPPIEPMSPSLPDDGLGPLPPGGAAPGQAEAARGRLALRGLGGCDRIDLTRREREDCETRRWADAAPVTARLNLDLAGRYARNPEPFLSRRPTDGCRLRLAGDVDVRGNDMNARAGVTCVKPF